jgi:hypothetical protein
MYWTVYTSTIYLQPPPQKKNPAVHTYIIKSNGPIPTRCGLSHVKAYVYAKKSYNVGRLHTYLQYHHCCVAQLWLQIHSLAEDSKTQIQTVLSILLYSFILVKYEYKVQR